MKRRRRRGNLGAGPPAGDYEGGGVATSQYQ
jgi:hypothetical protein